MLRIIPKYLLVLLLSISLIHCGANKTTKGGAIGAGAGGVIGGAIGSKYGKTIVGAIIGAAVGGAAGALIGNYMDKQAEEIKKDIAGAKVERIGEGIKITFPSGILFDVDKSNLGQTAQNNIQDLAKILNKYKDTNILIEGHTDSDGSEEYNQKLSERRAESVSDFLKNLNVQSSRLTSKGYGETQPVATNETSGGKQQNRRVDIAIFANDKLKEAAKSGKLES